MYCDEVNSFIEHSSTTLVDDMNFDDVFLAHHGILNQKWGRRRYQNADGSLTPLGRVHYGVGAARKTAGNVIKTAKKAADTISEKSHNRKTRALDKKIQKAEREREIAEKKKLIDDINKDTQKINNSLNPKRKSLNEMSDNEIINYMNRMKNVQTIKDMERDEGKSRFRKAAEEALIKGASKAVISLTNDALTKAGNKIIDGLFESPKETKNDDAPLKKLLRGDYASDGGSKPKISTPKKDTPKRDKPKRDTPKRDKPESGSGLFGRKQKESKSKSKSKSPIDIFADVISKSNSDAKRGREAVRDMMDILNMSTTAVSKSSRSAGKEFVNNIISNSSRMLPPASLPPASLPPASLPPAKED